MALSQSLLPLPGGQGVSRPCGRPFGCRRCLLKGCERWFRPTHPQARYCGPACQAAARRWRRWHAGHRYRATDQGKQHRRDQSRRYRQRRAEPPDPGEGQRPAGNPENFREDLATGQGATNSSCPRPARRSNTSVVPRADRRSGGFASVRYGGGSDGEVASSRAGCRVGGHQRPRVDVVEYLARFPVVLSCQNPQDRGGSGREGFSRPPVSFL